MSNQPFQSCAFLWTALLVLAQPHWPLGGCLFAQAGPKPARVLPRPTLPPVHLLSLTAQPTSAGVDIAVAVQYPAPPQGAQISLSSDSAALQLPVRVIVPPGLKNGHITIQYANGAPATNAVLRATSPTNSLSTVLSVAIPGWVSDAAGDARSIAGGVAPDLIAASATISNGVLTLRARFVPKSYDPAKTVTAFSLDAGRDADNGWAGYYPDGGDPGLMRTNVVVLTGGACYGPDATLYTYNPETKLLQLTGVHSTVVPVSGGFDLQIPGWLVGSPSVSFRAVTWADRPSCEYIGSSDAAPDPGVQPGRSAKVDSRLPAPSMTAASDMLATGNTVRFSWGPVVGAQYYLLAVDETNNGVFSSDAGSSWLLRSVPDTSYSFKFTGKGPGRWRVWPVDESGQPGAASPWH